MALRDATEMSMPITMKAALPSTTKVQGLTHLVLPWHMPSVRSTRAKCGKTQSWREEKVGTHV